MNWFMMMNEISILILAILILLLNFVFKSKKYLGYLSASALLIIGVLNIIFINTNASLFNGVFKLDSFSLFFKEFFILIAFIVILFSINYVKKNEICGEYYAIILFILLGMCSLVSSCELITIFISLELISIPLYTLVALRKNKKESAEGALKYFLLGAFSSAILLFGMSLLYAVTGTTSLDGIYFYFAAQYTFSPVAALSLLMLIAGFGFKIAAAPFHMWAPDVYEGAPSPVAAFISIGPKAAGIAVIIRVIQWSMSGLDYQWSFIFAALALFSMVIGNLAAMGQENFKRMLAYSGIAQIGYILVGLSAATLQGAGAAVFYILIYALTNLAAFGVIILYAYSFNTTNIKDLSGLSKKSPALAFVLLISLLSLAGIPPLAGFFGKFYLFLAAFNQGMYFLVAMAVINSVISLYYYLKVLNYVYLREAVDNKPIKINWNEGLSFALCSAAIIVFGLYPPLINYIMGFIGTLFG